LFAHAAGLAEEAGHDLMRLWVKLDAAVLAEVDRARAVEALRSLAQEAESMGALSEQQLAVQRLRALGVRTWRRGPTSDAGALSSREREIADLRLWRRDQPGDRPDALPLAQDRRTARLTHSGQARRPEPR